jgi:hypothetical protein
MIDAAMATPMAATTTWTSNSIQSMPLVAVGKPSWWASHVPMNADTMPTRIVTSKPIGCLPGSTSRPRRPTTMPMRIALMMPVIVMFPPLSWGEGAIPLHQRE